MMLNVLKQHMNTKNFLVSGNPGIFSLVLCRYKSHGNLRKNRLKNPWVVRHTDFIKLLCIGLVKYERIQTTLERAKKLEQYANLLIEMTQRKQAPPDITIVLQNGFLLRPDEIEEKFLTRRLINRKWKKRTVYPDPLSEDEYAARCREEASKILLQDKEAIDKLFGELADRYRGKYGGFVHVKALPNLNKGIKKFPNLAYVEFNDNGLPPLPVFPKIAGGKLLKGQKKRYRDMLNEGDMVFQPRKFLPHELEKFEEEEEA